jgi:F-type H+-transporting ATPase subunit epsilon
MAAFKLEIVTPEKTVYSGEVSHVQAPGSEGSFGVLVGHVPFLTSLQTGVLSFDEEGGTRRKMAVSGGFAQVAANGVTVLAETAESEERIDVERARAARQRAEERLKNAPGDIDGTRAHAALTRAINRLKVSGQL